VRRGTALVILLTLAACAPKPEAKPAEPLALDCGQDFEAQKAAITAQPSLSPAPKDPAEPYRFYSTADGRASWLITEPGAPGHPAILMQVARGSDVTTTGCPYGDKAGYQQLHAYLDSLKSWRRK
jgi:hypothetical protein